MKTVTNLFLYIARFFLKLEFLQIQCVKEIKTLILYSTMFLEDLYVREIMWKNIVEPDSPDDNFRLMCIACWITKATNTSSEYVTVVAFPRQ